MSTSSRRAKAPSYRHHKPSGQAFVQLKKRRYYLGKHDSPQSREAYARFIAEHWASADASPAPAEARNDLSIVELIERYWAFAELHYVKHGEPTGTLQNIKPALRRFKQLYGNTPATSFGPLALKALRQTWVRDNLSIKTVNDYTATIKRAFRWAVSEELVPETVHRALSTVGGFARGRSQARETKPVGPVNDETMEATLRYLPPIVADLVRFERLTGCRPGEGRLLRPCDINREPVVWEYLPARHKTEHHGHHRVVHIGPRAQEVLRPHLLRLAFTPDAYVFSTSTGRPYSKDGYPRAIKRAREVAFNMPLELRERAIRTAKEKYKNGKLRADHLAALKAAAKIWHAQHRWTPNQLRHAAATQIRKEFDAESSQVVLGHKELRTTEIYADRDLTKAAAIMRQIG
jgi:hypothetical protein